MRRQIVSTIYNNKENSSSGFQIIRTFVKVDPNIYKNSEENTTTQANQILLFRNRLKLSP